MDGCSAEGRGCAICLAFKPWVCLTWRSNCRGEESEGEQGQDQWGGWGALPPSCRGRGGVMGWGHGAGLGWGGAGAGHAGVGESCSGG